MPRSTKSKRVTALSTAHNKELTVPTATKIDTSAPATEDDMSVRELPFTVNITPAEEGFKPDRSPAGRKRIPSPFEPLLPDLKGKGWQNQPHDGKVTPESEGEDGTPKFNKTSSVADSSAKAILRELQKAVKYLNSEEGGSLNLGLDTHVTAELVQFNVRNKQDRKPRTPQGEEMDEFEDSDEFDEDDVDDETTGDE